MEIAVTRAVSLGTASTLLQKIAKTLANIDAKKRHQDEKGKKLCLTCLFAQYSLLDS
jgi:hypothetical protein